MKFFSLLSVLFFTFISVASAQVCVVNLQCGQELQISWESQGPIREGSCLVRSPSGRPVGNACSSPWIPVDAESGTYIFTARNDATGAPLQSTCQINMPTNCGGGDFTISASPNPVQVCAPATQGTTNISWSIPSGKTGGIRASSQPGWFVPAGTSISSSQPAPWITTAQSPHTFTLFETTGGTETPRATVSVSTTNASCSSTGPQCGNGTVEGSEQCDAGTANGNGTSGCSSDCRLTSTGGTGFCGDSTVQNPNANGQAEQCDLGSQNGQVGSACSATCQNTGSGIEYRRCDATLGCVSAGTHASYDACVAANNGQACVTNCNACQQATTQVFYKCGTNSCETVGEYFDIATCNSLHGTCYTDPTCNNQCSSLPPASINLGWNSSYTEKSKTVTAPGSGTLYVNTGGRTGCSISGNFTNDNQFGINMPQGSNPNFSMGTNYAVTDRPAGFYTYTLSCPGVPSSVSATLTVNATTPSAVSCTPPFQFLSSGSATISWSTTLGSNATCTANDVPQAPGQTSGIFSVSAAGQYTVSCRDDNGARGSATCEVTNALPPTEYKCVNGSCVECVGTESGCRTLAQCQVTCNVDPCANGQCNAQCPQNCTDSAQCGGAGQIVVTPSPVFSGKSFNISMTFLNTGRPWTFPQYTAVRTVNGNPQGNFGLSGTPLTLSVSPVSYLGSISFSTQLNAPILPDGILNMTFPLSYAMAFNGTPFANGQCSVNGGVLVRNPQCNDGEDNDGDGKRDCGITINGVPYEADPACFPDGRGGGGQCDKTRNSEYEGDSGIVSITANPQLVRSGGSSRVTFSCGAANWSINGKVEAIQQIPDSNVCQNPDDGRCGLGPVTNVSFMTTGITNRETYTLLCGNQTRSATISVIKINEF